MALEYRGIEIQTSNEKAPFRGPLRDTCLGRGLMSKSHCRDEMVIIYTFPPIFQDRTPPVRSELVFGCPEEKKTVKLEDGPPDRFSYRPEEIGQDRKIRPIVADRANCRATACSSFFRRLPWIGLKAEGTEYLGLPTRFVKWITVYHSLRYQTELSLTSQRYISYH